MNLYNQQERINKIRHFNRFYTNIIGILDKKLLKSRYSLAQSRILYEIHHAPGITASDIVKTIHVDPAQISRILNKFEQETLISKKRSAEDTRKISLQLTPQGKAAYETLRDLSIEYIQSLIDSVPEEDQNRIIRSMEDIERIFRGDTGCSNQYITLRSFRPGDIGYVIHRHGVIYSREYGFDESFDAYVAAGTADFISNIDRERENMWIAELGRETVGSIAAVKHDEDTAQLRWLLVETKTRGKGLGKMLVKEAVSFAQRKGYKRMMLWTLKNLKAARTLYQKEGFHFIEEKTHLIWGRHLTEEKWEIEF